MKSVKFVFGVHNHQPLGNFDFVFEHAFQHSYKPFIEVVSEFPDISLVLHFSGCLLQWLEENHPEYLEDVRQLVSRGNVEILSGGFYEPILIMLPDRDKVGQIIKMNKYIQDRFDYDAQGIWLTERVWEAHLPRPISEAGLRYATVDDYHFISSGKTERELTGYFLTEEQGYPLGIFPISQKLRYAIPFHSPEETIEYLRSFATEEGDRCIVMVDDGEKFGVWPGTYDTVFRQNWLRKFLGLLTENREWLHTTTFKEYFQQFPPTGRVYLPSASYFEMSEWTLPPDLYEKFDDYVQSLQETGKLEELKPFVKGGVWRNFLYKYDESNWMHKKLLNLLRRLYQLREKDGISDRDFKNIRDHLWKGTCNCAYWHGIFGGLYLPHLRQAIYQELILAEKQIDRIEYKDKAGITVQDFDLDGEQEIRLYNSEISLICAPHRGGILQELSLKNFNFNLLNTIRRYREGYHKKVQASLNGEAENGKSIHEQILSKEKNLSRYLIYDQFLRKALLDHVISVNTTVEQLYRNQHEELANFLSARYEYQINEGDNSISLFCPGIINSLNVYLRKYIALKGNLLRVEYTFEMQDEGEVEFRFAPELNFALLGGNAPDRYYQLNHKRYPLNSLKELRGINRIVLVTEWDGFSIEVGAPTADGMFLFPIETVSLSEGGFERVYQSSVVIPYKDVFLKNGELLQYTLFLEVIPV